MQIVCLYTQVACVHMYRVNMLLHSRHQPIMLIFHLLCYAAVLKILTYYAHVCLKFDCSIRVYSQNY